MYQSFCAFLAIVIIGLVIAVIVLASKTKEQYRSSMMPTALPPRQITIFRPVQPTSLPSLSSKSNSNDINIHPLILPLIGVCQLNLMQSSSPMPMPFDMTSVDEIKGLMTPQLGSLAVDLTSYNSILPQDGADMTFVLNGFVANCVDPNRGSLNSEDLCRSCSRTLILNLYGTFDVMSSLTEGQIGIKGTVIIKIPTGSGNDFSFVGFMVCANQVNPSFPPIQGYC